MMKRALLVQLFLLIPNWLVAQDSQGLYNTVQSLYGSYRTLAPNDCGRIRSVVQQIEGYGNRRELVPADRAYSVMYPNQVANPTIGDLARDRVIRLTMQFKSCFAAETPASDPEGVRLYQEVQGIYEQYASIPRGDCAQAVALAGRLDGYRGIGTAVPADRAYSVRFPRQVSSPTIGQLAEDRTERIRMQFDACFRAPQIDPNLLAALNGTWFFRTDNSDFQMTISTTAASLTAVLDQHKYSYPPRFTEYSSIAPNGVGLRFAVGPEHFVDYQIYLNSGQLTGYVTTTWQGVGMPITLTNRSVQAPNLMQGGFTARFYRSITDYNSSLGTQRENEFAAIVRQDPVIDFNWGQGAPDPSLPAEGFVGYWVGHIVVPLSGTYTLTAVADDVVQVLVDRKMLIKGDYPSAMHHEQAVYLSAGQPTHLQLVYVDRSGDAQVALYISGPNMERQLVR